MVFPGLLLLLVLCLLAGAAFLHWQSKASEPRMDADQLQCCAGDTVSSGSVDHALLSATGPPGIVSLWRLSESSKSSGVCQCLFYSAVPISQPLGPMATLAFR